MVVVIIIHAVCVVLLLTLIAVLVFQVNAIPKVLRVPRSIHVNSEISLEWDTCLHPLELVYYTDNASNAISIVQNSYAYRGYVPATYAMTTFRLRSLVNKALFTDSKPVDIFGSVEYVKVLLERGRDPIIRWVYRGTDGVNIYAQKPGGDRVEVALGVAKSMYQWVVDLSLHGNVQLTVAPVNQHQPSGDFSVMVPLPGIPVMLEPDSDDQFVFWGATQRISWTLDNPLGLDVHVPEFSDMPLFSTKDAVVYEWSPPVSLLGQTVTIELRAGRHVVQRRVRVAAAIQIVQPLENSVYEMHRSILVQWEMMSTSGKVRIKATRDSELEGTDMESNVFTPTSPGTYTITVGSVDFEDFFASVVVHVVQSPTILLPEPAKALPMSSYGQSRMIAIRWSNDSSVNPFQMSYWVDANPSIPITYDQIDTYKQYVELAIEVPSAGTQLTLRTVCAEFPSHITDHVYPMVYVPQMGPNLDDAVYAYIKDSTLELTHQYDYDVPEDRKSTVDWFLSVDGVTYDTVIADNVGAPVSWTVGSNSGTTYRFRVQRHDNPHIYSESKFPFQIEPSIYNVSLERISPTDATLRFTYDGQTHVRVWAEKNNGFATLNAGDLYQIGDYKASDSLQNRGEVIIPWTGIPDEANTYQIVARRHALNDANIVIDAETLTTFTCQIIPKPNETESKIFVEGKTYSIAYTHEVNQDTNIYVSIDGGLTFTLVSEDHKSSPCNWTPSAAHISINVKFKFERVDNVYVFSVDSVSHTVIGVLSFSSPILPVYHPGETYTLSWSPPFHVAYNESNSGYEQINIEADIVYRHDVAGDASVVENAMSGSCDWTVPVTFMAAEEARQYQMVLKTATVVAQEIQDTTSFRVLFPIYDARVVQVVTVLTDDYMHVKWRYHGELDLTFKLFANAVPPSWSISPEATSLLATITMTSSTYRATTWFETSYVLDEHEAQYFFNLNDVVIGVTTPFLTVHVVHSLSATIYGVTHSQVDVPKLLYPNGGNVYYPDSVINIAWEGSVGDIWIYLADGDGVYPALNGTSPTSGVPSGNFNTWNWVPNVQLPTLESTTLRIRISKFEIDQYQRWDESDTFFTVAHPVTGITLQQTMNAVAITAAYVSTTVPLSYYYYAVGNTIPLPIVENVLDMDPTVTWDTTGLDAGDYIIRVKPHPHSHPSLYHESAVTLYTPITDCTVLWVDATTVSIHWIHTNDVIVSYSGDGFDSGSLSIGPSPITWLLFHGSTGITPGPTQVTLRFELSDNPDIYHELIFYAHTPTLDPVTGLYQCGNGIGLELPISWTFYDEPENLINCAIDLLYSTNGTDYYPIVEALPVGDALFNWYLPEISAELVTIKIRLTENPNVYDISSGPCQVDFRPEISFYHYLVDDDNDQMMRVSFQYRGGSPLDFLHRDSEVLVGSYTTNTEFDWDTSNLMEGTTYNMTLRPELSTGLESETALNTTFTFHHTHKPRLTGVIKLGSTWLRSNDIPITWEYNVANTDAVHLYIVYENQVVSIAQNVATSPHAWSPGNIAISMETPFQFMIRSASDIGVRSDISASHRFSAALISLTYLSSHTIQAAWYDGFHTTLYLKYSLNDQEIIVPPLSSSGVQHGLWSYQITLVNEWTSNNILQVFVHNDAQYTNATHMSMAFQLSRPQLIYPRGGSSFNPDNWLLGSTTARITWLFSGEVLVYYYTVSAPATFNLIGASDTGYLDWIIPDISATGVKIRVSQESNPLVFDNGESTFKIIRAVSDVRLTNTSLIVGSLSIIRWRNFGEDLVDLKYSLDGGKNYPYTIEGASSLPPSHPGYYWNLPDPLGGVLKIGVFFSDSDSTSPVGRSGDITLDYSVSNLTCQPETPHMLISWTYPGTRPVELHFKVDNGSYSLIEPVQIRTINSVYWLNAPASSRITVRIRVASNPAAFVEQTIMNTVPTLSLSPTPIQAYYEMDQLPTVSWAYSQPSDVTAIPVSLHMRSPVGNMLISSDITANGNVTGAWTNVLSVNTTVTMQLYRGSAFELPSSTFFVSYAPSNIRLMDVTSTDVVIEFENRAGGLVTIWHLGQPIMAPTDALSVTWNVQHIAAGTQVQLQFQLSAFPNVSSTFTFTRHRLCTLNVRSYHGTDLIVWNEPVDPVWISCESFTGPAILYAAPWAQPDQKEAIVTDTISGDYYYVPSSIRMIFSIVPMASQLYQTSQVVIMEYPITNVVTTDTYVQGVSIQIPLTWNYSGVRDIEVLLAVDNVSFSNVVSTITDQSKSYTHLLTANATRFRLRLKDYPSVYMDSGTYYKVHFDLHANYVKSNTPAVQIDWLQPSAFDVLIRISSGDQVFQFPGFAGKNRWTWEDPPTTLITTCEIVVEYTAEIRELVVFELYTRIEKIFTAPNSYLPLNLQFSTAVPCTIGRIGTDGVVEILGISPDGNFELNSQSPFIYGDNPVTHTITIGVSAILHIPWATRTITLTCQRYFLEARDHLTHTMQNDGAVVGFQMRVLSTRPWPLQVTYMNHRTGENIPFYTSHAWPDPSGRWMHWISFILPISSDADHAALWRYTGNVTIHVSDISDPSLNITYSQFVDFPVWNVYGRHNYYGGGAFDTSKYTYQVTVNYWGTVRRNNFSLRRMTGPYDSSGNYESDDYTYDASTMTFDFGQGPGHKITMRYPYFQEYTLEFFTMALRVFPNETNVGLNYGQANSFAQVNTFLHSNFIAAIATLGLTYVIGDVIGFPPPPPDLGLGEVKTGVIDTSETIASGFCGFFGC